MTPERSLIRGNNGFIGARVQERFNAVVIPRSLEIPEGKFATLFYCAGYGNMNWQTESNKIWQVNYEDFQELTLGTDYHTVYFSTSNGNPEYVASKLAGEKIADVVIRPYSVTGVGEQKEHLIPTAIDCAFTGKTLTLDPDPVHDFIDIDDLLDAVELVRHIPGIYEVGAGNQWTNGAVIELIEKVTNKKININLVEGLLSYDKSVWCANNFNLKKLGWEPKKSLEQSIKEMVDAYEKS